MAQEVPIHLGIVQVPVENLYFNEQIRGRQYNRKQVQHLKSLFDKTTIQHEDHRHWIDGYVDRSNVTLILEWLGGSMALQHRNAAGTYPFLGNHRVAYTHGRHRVEASRKINAQSCWTVVLHSTDLRSLATNQVIQRRTEQCHHEASYTSGHIYTKLREYPVSSKSYHEWHMRLSLNKRKNFHAVNGHPGVSRALDRLVCFPGIIDALYLGNICKYSAWGLLSEFQTCLEHIYNEWSHYVRGNSAAPRDVTPETVELLEGRAPSTSLTDREWVRTVFQARTAFPTIINQKQRDELENSILRRQGIVPSLRSCQANMLYLGIAAQIIWSLIIPNDPELKRTVRAEDGIMTLRSVLRKCWVETEPYVEVREGVFQAALGAPNFDLAYSTVVVAALRQFVYMSRDEPKVEAGDVLSRVSTDDRCSCEALFHRRARLLGFRSHLVEEGATKPVAPFLPDWHASDIEEEEGFLSRVERRWGRPFARAFPIIQKVAFLPRIFGGETRPGKIAEVFVLKDLVQSFLPPLSFDLDNSYPTINLNDMQSPLNVRNSNPSLRHIIHLPLGREVGMNYELDTEMDVDPPSQGAEDVIMSDSCEPAESEKSEGSHFWEHLMTEYQSVVSDSNPSGSPVSDTSTIVLNRTRGEENIMTDESSPIPSLPSYSMVGDRSRTAFTDSAPSSRSGGSTVWSSSGSEQHPTHGSVSKLQTSRYTERRRPVIRNALISNNRPVIPREHMSSSEARVQGINQNKSLRRSQPHLVGCYCSQCDQTPSPESEWDPQTTTLSARKINSSQQNMRRPQSRIYSTSPERSVLLSPSVGLSQPQLEHTTVAAAKTPSGHLTWASFYTDSHQRSILPSPRVLGVGRGTDSVSGGSGQSAHHSHSSKYSPILSGFSNAPTRVSIHRDYRLFGPEDSINQENTDRGWQGFIDSDDSLTTISLS